MLLVIALLGAALAALMYGQQKLQNPPNLTSR